MKLKKFWTNVNFNVGNSITLFSKWNNDFDAAESWADEKTYFCTPTSRVQTCRKLMRNTNQLFSELHNCLSGEGGYAANATQLNKVKKDTQERMEWKKWLSALKTFISRLIM